MTYFEDYAADFLGRTSAALSCRYPVDFTLHRSFAQNDPDPGNEPRGWPAFLLDLIPQGFGRAALAEELGVNTDRDSSDWPLLLEGAGNPVGNIRIQEAVRETTRSAQRGFTLDEIVSREESFVDYAREHRVLLPGTSGIQGDAPKMMLVVGRDGLWHADGTLPEKDVKEHVIIKLRRGKTERDLKVLRNEAPYMAVADFVGLRANPGVLLRGNTLFIPRFDRQNGGFLGQESLFSLVGINEYGRRAAQIEFCRAIRNFSSDPAEDIIEFILRDVLNVSLGNTDNHGRNSAVLRYPDDSVRLSPIFDFAPMVLDPDGVARRYRWRCEDEGGLDWDAVAREVEGLLGKRTALLRRRFADLADKMNGLEETMRRLGVDEDLIESRSPAIAAQRRNLREAA